jgi:hypothetical protein
MNKSSVDTTPANPSEPCGDRMLLCFEEGKASLSQSQMEVLHHWIRQWINQRKSTILAIGGACKASRAGMLRRVHHLLDALLCLGVCRKKIQQDNRWSAPAKMGAVDDLPPDTVWLELKASKDDAPTRP